MKERDFKVTCREPTPEMLEAAYPIFMRRPIDTPARARRAAYDLWKEMWEVAPEAYSTGLTRLQDSVHRAIANYVAYHGKAPTWVEIMERSLVNDAGQLRQLIMSLEKMGILTRVEKYRRRNIRLLVLPGEEVQTLNQGRGKKT